MIDAPISQKYDKKYLHIIYNISKIYLFLFQEKNMDHSFGFFVGKSFDDIYLYVLIISYYLQFHMH